MTTETQTASSEMWMYVAMAAVLAIVAGAAWYYA